LKIQAQLDKQRKKAAFLATESVLDVTTDPIMDIAGYVWDPDKRRYFPQNRQQEKQIVLMSSSTVVVAADIMRDAKCTLSVLEMLRNRDLGRPCEAKVVADQIISATITKSLATTTTTDSICHRGLSISLQDSNYVLFNEADLITAEDGFERGCAEGLLKRLKVKKKR
jgi:hypothetical protein